MPEILELRRLGDPILREAAEYVEIKDIESVAIQSLIANIRYTNQTKQYGVGLSAPQVGHPLAVSVIGIEPTPNQPELEPFESVIINPQYAGAGGRRVGMWESCQSAGSGEDLLFGKALRHEHVRAWWYDEHARYHIEILSGFVAQVFQHETDHLNGILFVDRVRDPKTFMMADEYRKRIIKG